MTYGLVSCATGRVEQPYVPGRSAPTRALPPDDPFPYDRRAVRLSNHVEGTRGEYVVRWLSFPSTGDNGQPENTLTVQYFERAEGERSPLVLVLPIWGGSAYPSAVVAADLVAERRVNVMRVLGDDTMVDWGILGRAPDAEAFQSAFRQMVKRMQDSVVDLRRLLDWAESRPTVDGNRVGLVGFSESTLQVAGLMASDPRLAAAALVMGGAHPHEILSACYGPPAAVRDEVTTRLGWSRARYAAILAPLMRPVDPAYLGAGWHRTGYYSSRPNGTTASPPAPGTRSGGRPVSRPGSPSTRRTPARSSA